MSWTCAFFVSVSVSEKNQLSKSELYPKKLPAQLPASATLQRNARRAERQPPTAIHPPGAACFGAATARPTENVNPRGPVRFRTHRIFRKLGAFRHIPCRTRRAFRRL